MIPLTSKTPGRPTNGFLLGIHRNPFTSSVFLFTPPEYIFIRHFVWNDHYIVINRGTANRLHFNYVLHLSPLCSSYIGYLKWRVIIYAAHGYTK